MLKVGDFVVVTVERPLGCYNMTTKGDRGIIAEIMTYKHTFYNVKTAYDNNGYWYSKEELRHMKRKEKDAFLRELLLK